MTDTISDLINRIMNAQGADLDRLDVPFSKAKAAVVDLLQKQGYLDSYKLDKEAGIISIEISPLKFEKIKRVSKPGKRVYVKANKIPRAKGPLGMYVISTSAGVISDKVAREKGLGGEVICEVIQ